MLADEQQSTSTIKLPLILLSDAVEPDVVGNAIRIVGTDPKLKSKLTDAEALAVASLLQKHELHMVDLSMNNISHIGAYFLAIMLKVLFSLLAPDFIYLRDRRRTSRSRT